LTRSGKTAEKSLSTQVTVLERKGLLTREEILDESIEVIGTFGNAICRLAVTSNNGAHSF
jgi:hypothetical protein